VGVLRGADWLTDLGPELERRRLRLPPRGEGAAAEAVDGLPHGLELGRRVHLAAPPPHSRQRQRLAGPRRDRYFRHGDGARSVEAAVAM
jgi:hypothetical protein